MRYFVILLAICLHACGETDDASQTTVNVSEAANVRSAPTPEGSAILDKPAPDALTFVGQYPSTLIQGYSIFDAPDLQLTIKGMPNGARILADINKIRQSLSVESPIRVENPGPYQNLIISLCEQHNCSGPDARQLLIEYSPSSKPNERQAFVCLKSGSTRSVYDPTGEGYMKGDECTEGGFFYGG